MIDYLYPKDSSKNFDEYDEGEEGDGEPKTAYERVIRLNCLIFQEIWIRSSKIRVQKNIK